MSDLTHTDAPNSSASTGSGITRPTILQIIPNLDSGGAERTIVEMTDAIVRAGGRSLVASNPGRLAPKIAEAGGTLIPFPAHVKDPVRIVSNASALVTLIKREGVNLMHARSRAPAWSAWIAARRAKIPFVTTYHGAYNEKTAIKKAYNSVMIRSDIVIANSPWTADLIRSRYGIREHKLVVIDRGVDPSVFDASRVSAERREKLRAAWGLAPNTRIILAPARLTPWKGQSVVIDATAELLRNAALSNVPFAVIFAGDAQGRTDYETALDTRARALGVEKIVHRVGHLDDVAAAFAMADVTVVASTEPEAFGRTSIEAQASGCPVIASAIGATPGTIVQGPAGSETGWSFKSGDPSDLARVLTLALTLPPDARVAIGQRARAHIQAHYTLTKLQHDTLRVYDRLLGTVMAVRFDESIKNTV